MIGRGLDQMLQDQLNVILNLYRQTVRVLPFLAVPNAITRLS
jgi:hypothetical protein